ncbi:MAG: 2Fe-2S iron-sulfur cluster-binding protein, partial [Evtepia sp.]
MVKLTIDNQMVEVTEGTTVLEAAAKINIKIPTLCYLKEINEVGACRVCAVEIEGTDPLCTACNTVVEEGMVVHTNTEQVRITRKTNVELILSQHDCLCATCVRSGNCALQTLANDMNILDLSYEKQVAKNHWDKTLPLIRDNSKCIKCLRCVSVCDKIQTLGVWELRGSGAHARVGVRDGAKLDEINCSFCGQCVTHCPVGALRERDDTEKVFEALRDPKKIVVVQIAPAVRAAWGDGLHLPAELATEKRMAAAVRALGAQYVFDTNFSADLTIMEEG